MKAVLGFWFRAGFRRSGFRGLELVVSISGCLGLAVWSSKRGVCFWGLGFGGLGLMLLLGSRVRGLGLNIWELSVLSLYGSKFEMLVFWCRGYRGSKVCPRVLVFRVLVFRVRFFLVRSDFRA